MKADEWTENTGSQPVAGNIIVDVKFADGFIASAYDADEWHWDMDNGITHWRLHEDAIEKEYYEGFSANAKETNPKEALGQSSLPLHLFSPLAVAYGCLGKLNGKLKYGESNFMATPVIVSIYVDAIRRHIDKWMSGQEFDQKDGVPHFSAILANVDIILSARAAGTLVDDRGMSKGYFKEIEELTPIVSALHKLHKDKTPHHYTLVEQLKEGDGSI